MQKCFRRKFDKRWWPLSFDLCHRLFRSVFVFGLYSLRDEIKTRALKWERADTRDPCLGFPWGSTCPLSIHCRPQKIQFTLLSDISFFWPTEQKNVLLALSDDNFRCIIGIRQLQIVSMYCTMYVIHNMFHIDKKDQM